ncbi:unnamed protein product, partial [marine sediment metagenome]
MTGLANLDKPKQPTITTPATTYKPREPMTSNRVVKLLLESLNTSEILIGDDLYLRDIFTAKPGFPNRNATYQRNIIKRVIDKLIEMRV